MEEVSIAILTFVIAGFVVSLISTTYQFYTTKNAKIRNYTNDDIGLLALKVYELMDVKLANKIADAKLIGSVNIDPEHHT